LRNRISLVIIALVCAVLAASCAQAEVEPPSGQFDALSYNVAGLPETLSGSSPELNTPIIGPLLKDYDLVLLQESWKTPEPNGLAPLRVYHEILEAASTHSFQSIAALQPRGENPTRSSAQRADGLKRFANHTSTTAGAGFTSASAYTSQRAVHFGHTRGRIA
jgi:hypothetical protein